MDIFISYRRDGGRDMARAIQLALKAAGYSDVFFDFNSLRDGVFNEQIIDAINECKDFLLILSKGSMDRCANEGDWVRREIKSAIDAGCKIIPVLVESEWNWPESFPKALNIIKSIQFTKVLNDEYFDDYMKRLIERLDSIPNTKKEIPISSIKTTETFLLKLSVDETAEILINNERVRKVKAGKTCVIDFLERGKTYSISVRSLAIRKDVFSFDITIPMFSNEVEKDFSFGEMRRERKEKEKEESEKRKKASEIASFERRKLKESRKTLMKQYDFVDSDYEGVCVVGKKDDKGSIKYGLMDEQGFEIVQCVSDDAAHMNEGLAAFSHNGQWSYYDKDGVPVLENVSEVPGFFIHGTVPIRQQGKYGLIDKDGRLLVPCENEYVYHSTGEFVVVKKSNRDVYLFIHRDSVLKRVAFDEIESAEMVISVDCKSIAYIPASISYYFSDKYYIKKGELKGLIDKDGQILIRCSAQEIEPMGESLFRVKVADRFGIFDVGKKKIVIPIKYRTLNPINAYYGYYYPYINIWSLYDRNDCYYLASEVGKEDELCLTSVFGIINSKDEVVIPMEYSYFTNASWFGVLCFKQIAVGKDLESDQEDFVYYIAQQLRNFAERSSFPKDSILIESKITAVLFQLDESAEQPMWNPSEMIVYENKQYNEYEMDGTPINKPVVSIEEKIKLLKERGYKQYENPLPFEAEKCAISSIGETERFCIFTLNGRFGVADNDTGLIVLPAEYCKIEEKRRYLGNNQNSIELNVFFEAEYYLAIDIYVLSDGTVWINLDRWRYSEAKCEEISRKYFSFLFDN